MLLGNSIDIRLSLEEDFRGTSILYNGEIVGGIQSVKLDVSAGAFGEEINQFTISMWEPREVFCDDDRVFFHQEFIEEARRAGANVVLHSVLEFSDSDMPPSQEDKVEKGSETVHLIAACLGIASLVAILGPKNKKHVVQKKDVVNSLDKSRYQKAARR